MYIRIGSLYLKISIITNSINIYYKKTADFCVLTQVNHMPSIHSNSHVAIKKDYFRLEYFWVGFHKANWILLAGSNGDQSWRELAVTWSWLADVLNAFPCNTITYFTEIKTKSKHSFFHFPSVKPKTWQFVIANSHKPSSLFDLVFTCNQDTV